MAFDTIELHDRSGGTGELVLAVHIPDAQPDDVLRHFTDPDLVTEWWAQESEIDLDGGTYVHRWPETGWTLGGRILDHRADNHLEFTWQWDHEPDAPELTVTVTVAPHDGGTELVLRHGPYAGDGDERQGHREGWSHYLPQLAAVISGGSASDGTATRTRPTGNKADEQHR